MRAAHACSTCMHAAHAVGLVSRHRLRKSMGLALVIAITAVCTRHTWTSITSTQPTVSAMHAGQSVAVCCVRSRSLRQRQHPPPPLPPQVSRWGTNTCHNRGHVACTAGPPQSAPQPLRPLGPAAATPSWPQFMAQEAPPATHYILHKGLRTAHRPVASHHASTPLTAARTALQQCASRPNRSPTQSISAQAVCSSCGHSGPHQPRRQLHTEPGSHMCPAPSHLPPDRPPASQRQHPLLQPSCPSCPPPLC